MSARDAILAKLKQAPVPAERIPLPQVAPWYDLYDRKESRAERIARLRHALVSGHAEVVDATPHNWPSLVLDLAVQKNVRTLLVGDHTAEGAALKALSPTSPALMEYTESIEAWQPQMFDQVDAALTRARSGIAETGSLIVWPDAKEPRLMSLVPPIHFIVLDTSAIHANFYEAMVAEQWADGMPANALLISSPSKTADIQQTLAYGAHGPRELIVVLVSEPSP